MNRRIALGACAAALLALSGAAGAVSFNSPMGRVLLGGGKPRISLSNATIASTATSGSTVGVLSVVGGKGTYTYTLTSNPGSLFAISGSNLNTAATLTAGSDPVTVQASNGAGSVITQPFTITVTGSGCSNSLDFTQACNSQYLF